MGAGVWNLVLGLAALAAGASGRFSLFGVGSPWLLAAFGGLLAIYGAFQIVRARRGG